MNTFLYAQITSGVSGIYNVDVQVAFEDQGMIMLRGEYESSKVVHGVMNDFLPKPYGFGKYKVQDPPTYFYLSAFVDMNVIKAPDPVEFTKRLAQLHKLSESPTGKFGFAVPTCDGQVARTVDWEENWAVFFRRLLLETCRRDVETNGPWPEMERATTQVADAVIPRLLGPLQENKRKLKPCIIHGDLWEGNTGIVRQTGRSILFDVGSYYAHNEMELGHWRCEFSSVFCDKKYTDAYKKSYPPAEPADEFDDRNRLYSLQGAINYSAGHPRSDLRNTLATPFVLILQEITPITNIHTPELEHTTTCAIFARSTHQSKVSISMTRASTLRSQARELLPT